MAVIPITKIPEEVLTTKAEAVTKKDNLAEIAANLLDTVRAAKNPEGAGLAAPQIGISKRVCVVRKFTRDKNNPEKELVRDYVLVNPEITSFSDATDIRWEACLSIPNQYGRVQRSKRIKVIAQNEKDEKVKLKAEGFFARVIQHEVDHLDGILFTSKVIGECKTDEEMDKMFEETQL